MLRYLIAISVFKVVVCGTIRLLLCLFAFTPFGKMRHKDINKFSIMYQKYVFCTKKFLTQISH